jgi:hypothetical protein
MTRVQLANLEELRLSWGSRCGLCGCETIGCYQSERSGGKPIDWEEYERYGRKHVTGRSVELYNLPEKVQSFIRQEKPDIREADPICNRCYADTLDKMWIAEQAVCKACNRALEYIGWSYDRDEGGHNIGYMRLMGCPECRLVYFIRPRPLKNTT